MLKLTLKTMRKTIVGTCACLWFLNAAFGQTVATAQSAAPSSQSATLQTFQQQQMALAQSFSAMMAQGATPQQMAGWQQQNAAAFAAQQQRAQIIGMVSDLRSADLMQQPPVPPNASQTVRDYLAAQVTLNNARAQIHNQLIQSVAGQSLTSDQLTQLQQQEMQLFQQQYGQQLQLQAQRAQTLADESVQTLLPVPGPTILPPNATPQLAAYLALRDQLMQEQVQLRNQYLATDPEVRDAAMVQWRQQNATRFQQLQQLAQSAFPANSTTSN